MRWTTVMFFLNQRALVSPSSKGNGTMTIRVPLSKLHSNFYELLLSQPSGTRRCGRTGLLSAKCALDKMAASADTSIVTVPRVSVR